MNKRNIIIAVVVIILVIAGIVYALKHPSGPKVEPLVTNYTSQKYQISLFIPQEWTAIPNEADSFIGESGTIKMSAVGGDGVTLEEVAFGEANHKLHPYGTTPILGNAMVANQPAKYIYPGSDQPAEFYGQAAVIVQYPKPVVIAGTQYQYFILWADQLHIQAIAATIQFLSQADTKVVTPGAGRGLLAGQVTVGPVCPLEREDQVCEPKPDMYTSQKVFVYSKTTKAQVAKLPIKEDGSYRIELAPGVYTVDMPHAGVAHSNDLPTDIVVTAGKTFVLNVDIDTGIR